MAILPDRTYATDVEPETTPTVAGWVHEKRTIGGLVFIELRDTSGRLQLKFEEETNAELLSIAEDVSRQSVVRAEGSAEADNRAPGGVELVPSSFEVLVEADTGLPLDPTGKVDTERPTRLDNRTLSLRAEEQQAIFEVRGAMLQGARDALRAQHATEINTSKIVATGTEGGAELFPITYFGREAFMNQSPQLFKQLAAGSALERVFEIGPIFRAEGSNTSRHLCEAVSIDFEGAFCDADDAMSVVENVVINTYQTVGQEAEDALSALGYDEFELPTGPFPRLTYAEAIERVNEIGAIDETLEWGDDLPTEAERALGDELGEHYFITQWPSEIKPFYIKDTDSDETVSTGFDLMHPRMELVSGGQREHRYEKLINGFEQQGLDPEQFDYYTDAFKYGMPPHAGWGLGGDRLLMTMLGLPNIRDGVLFPRDQQRLMP